MIQASFATLLRTLQKFFDLLQRDFIAGLLTLAPLGVTIWAISWIFGFLDNLLLPRLLRIFGVDASTRPPFVGVIFSVVFIVIFGILARHFFGQRLVAIWEDFLTRIPVARSIYGAVKQLVETIIQTNGQEQFRRVVLLEYPRKGIYGIGFMTNRAANLLPEAPHLALVSVFVPTTPNPTSGFYLLVPESELIDIDISVEEAFKLVMSAGLVLPERFSIPNSTSTSTPAQSSPT